jgi:hypothetical protein
MEAMRKEIERLNEIIGKGYLSGKAQVSHKKVDEPKKPQFKEGILQSSLRLDTLQEPRQMKEMS